MESKSRFVFAALAGVCMGWSAGTHGLELSEAELFLELNNTDGDLGIHCSVDGGPYERLKIKTEQGATALQVEAHGRAGKHGLTQLFFESAEPNFEELPPEEFFARFPEGVYTIEVEYLGEEAEEDVELSHVMPAPPPNVRVNGIPAAASCDSDPLPVVTPPVLIDWEPVTESHPEIGRQGEFEIDRYQFFVDVGDNSLAIDLPPTLTEFLIPESITAPGGQFKFEIIARADNLNNTAIESCFIVE